MIRDDSTNSTSSTKLSVICLDLERTLKKSPISKYIRDRLGKLARYTGSFRYIVGLFSNYIVIRRLEQGLEPPEIKKVFYDRCWASINLKIGGNRKRNEFSDLLDEFIQASGLDINFFPPPVSCRLQETVTREMEISGKNSVTIHLESKVKGFMEHRLTNNHHFGILSKNDQKRLICKLCTECLEKNLGVLDQRFISYVLEVRNCIPEVLQMD